MTFLYLYGTLILLYFHRYFLVWFLTMLAHCPGYVLSLSISLGKTVQILPQ